MILDKDPKKMASGVLARAFGGKVTSDDRYGENSAWCPDCESKHSGECYSEGGMVAKGNFEPRGAGSQPSESVFGNPGEGTNFKGPKENVQRYDEGGEVDEGKVVAAEEAMAAFHSKDAKKLAMALDSFFDQSMAGDDEEETEI